MGIEVVNIFVNKCIVYFRNDSYAEILKTALDVIKPKLNKNFIKNMISSANSYGLTKIKQYLN
jgi:ribosomal protein S7